MSLQSLQSQASAASAAAGHQAPAEHTVTLSVPPALPPKRRSVRGPPHGHYDNVPAAAASMGARVPESVSMDGVVLRSRRPLRHDHDDSEPPPLPMKKKHGQWPRLQFWGGWSVAAVVTLHMYATGLFGIVNFKWAGNCYNQAVLACGYKNNALTTDNARDSLKNLHLDATLLLSDTG